jgi:hypothetical protein
LPADKDSSLALAEYRSYKAANAVYFKALQSTVRNVAAKLREADDSSMHILQCQGFSDDVFEKRFVLHFSFPAKRLNPRSLRNLLADQSNTRGKKHSRVTACISHSRLQLLYYMYILVALFTRI